MTITYNDVDSTYKASLIAAAMVNAVHPDDRAPVHYEDAANAASQWVDDMGIGCPDTADILRNLVKMFGISNYWEF